MCNKLDTALYWQEKAMEYCLQHNGENSILYINYLADLAYLFKQNSMIGKSYSAYHKLIDLLEINNLDSIPFYNDKISEVCELYEAEKDYVLEYQFLKERKQKSFDKYGGNTPFYAWICNRLSIYEMNKEMFEEARGNNMIAEKLYYQLEGKNSYNYAAAIHNKGRMLMLEGKYKQALKYLNESKQIQFEVNGNVSEMTELYIQELENKLK